MNELCVIKRLGKTGGAQPPPMCAFSHELLLPFTKSLKVPQIQKNPIPSFFFLSLILSSDPDTKTATSPSISSFEPEN
ncbi:hypothetical protein HRI_001855000 [Hibiscus trionum]|uniref:Uncharacterized protein n=1 Tax=Hibiscus trionum TaxID=183268 RepID=A0A9W7LXU2_HIBTR|nr:hypothetical protein HRI_001855000 [Hibiscus trionum]